MEKIYKQVLKVLKRAEKIYYNQSFIECVSDYKHPKDDVTSNDIATQKFLVEQFGKLIKGSGFIAEEQLCDDKNKEYVWIIDPIDGTFNYKNGLEIYGTQIALKKNGKVIFSAVHLPFFKRTYSSYNGKSFVNGVPIKTSQNDVSKSLIFNLTLFNKRKPLLDANILLSYLKTKKVRIFGATCFDFCMVAEGKIDCLITNGNTQWDIEPGLFLAKNAGAKTLKLKDSNLLIVAGNNKILNEVEKSLRLI